MIFVKIDKLDIDSLYGKSLREIQEGQIIKLPIKNIPRLSRDTQGVILMRFTDKKDIVTTAATV